MAGDELAERGTDKWIREHKRPTRDVRLDRFLHDGRNCTWCRLENEMVMVSA
jgi:hypothetical protein